jgi:hypothetical protein
VRKSEAAAGNGGHFNWQDSQATQFCAVWEEVVARYGEVARVEEEVARGRAVKGGRWEEYLRVLGWFGEGVRWFGEGFCGGG